MDTNEQNKPPTNSPTKECPFCGETVLAKAKKCKHCRELLDVVLRAAEEARRTKMSGAGGSGGAGAASTTVVIQDDSEPPRPKRREFPHLPHLVMWGFTAVFILVLLEEVEIPKAFKALAAGLWIPVWIAHYLWWDKNRIREKNIAKRKATTQVKDLSSILTNMDQEK